MNELKAIIEDAFENRDSISPTSAPEDVKKAVAEAIDLLNSGKARVAEKTCWRMGSSPVAKESRFIVLSPP
ncbi:hypothetical protein KUL42_07030 [Alteromonas sp. KUL42]|uniref:hypothetical protein n=1 Tax=Alteromonas sp. KUL42 TaxID=2480797 RepID=UPI0010FFC2B1|nr:hypothetical protein KUL42_07030 [Alteromonas sp. KUL42]